MFVVRVDPDVVDGTVISNQGFVSAPAGGVLDQPSDDPRTPEVNDPTRNMVGNLPVIFAEKTVALQVDTVRPASSIPAISCATRFASTTTARAGNQGRAARRRAGEHDLRRRHADAEWPARRATGRWRVPDGGRHLGELLGPDASGAAANRACCRRVGRPSFSSMRVNDATPSGTLIINQATVTTEKSVRADRW